MGEKAGVVGGVRDTRETFGSFRTASGVSLHNDAAHGQSSRGVFLEPMRRHVRDDFEGNNNHNNHDTIYDSAYSACYKMLNPTSIIIDPRRESMRRTGEG